MRTSSLVLFAAVAVFGAATAAAGDESWKTIDANDRHVQDVALWAVAETDWASATGGLTLNTVDGAEKRFEAGVTYYRLTLEASSRVAKYLRFQAAVYEEGDEHKLVSFVPIH
uniref:Cystatin domain-containing protein n=1 Tax=Oryza meridionalis TaxID=40149 RepID=A0A0E0CX11_9ORYZ